MSKVIAEQTTEGQGLAWFRNGPRLQIVLEPVRPLGVVMLLVASLSAFFLWKMGYQFPERFDATGVASLLFLVPSLACSYFGAMLFFNRRTLDIGPKEVLVSIAPLPWPGSVQVARSAVAGFALEKKVRKVETGHNVSYTLVAQLREGGTLPLLTRMPKAAAKRVLELVMDALA